MRRIVLSAFALLCVAAPAAAAPFDLPDNSPLFIQFRNLEQVDFDNDIDISAAYAPAVGTQGNWGVLNVSSIQLGGVGVPNTTITGGPVIWSDDGGPVDSPPAPAEGQITGIFYGIQIDPVDRTKATGGTLDLYWEDAADDDISAACLTGAGCPANAATIGLFTDGVFLARINFASGIDPFDPTQTIQSSTAPTIGVTGFADSFGNVDVAAGGAWAADLNGDWFHTAFGTRDLRFRNIFSSLPAWDGTVAGNFNGSNATNATLGFESSDPATVFTAPEPTSLALFGLGLAGLAVQQRRRMRANRS